MTLPKTNKFFSALVKEGETFELVRGTGYHYYVWTVMEGEKVLDYDSHSIYVPYFNQRPMSAWVEDGLEFLEKMRAKRKETLAMANEPGRFILSMKSRNH